MLYAEAFSKVLPVLLLIALGALLRRVRFFPAGAIQGIKALVVNITLPAVLFLAFSSVSLEPAHLAIIVLVFALCGVALLLGRAISRWGMVVPRPPLGADSAYLPALLTGFEAGMMGYAIYGAVFGAGNIFQFAIVDLGQVLFVFFILVPYVQRIDTGPAPFQRTLVNFLRTPVILSILLGILGNRTGIVAAMGGFPPTAAVLQALQLLAAATTPLITLVIGYELNLRRHNLAAPLRTIGLRLAYWIPLGLLLNALVVDRLFPGATALKAAVMTMFVLPPPFVIPIFVSHAGEQDQDYVVNTLSLATLVTLVAFTLVSVFFAG